MGLVKLPCPRLWAAPGLKQAKAVNLLLSSVKFLTTSEFLHVLFFFFSQDMWSNPGVHIPSMCFLK